MNSCGALEPADVPALRYGKSEAEVECWTAGATVVPDTAAKEVGNSSSS